ncbi:hypothetical protein CB1_000239002 [Camelus ferus]|nr:hypothetical protein CB1_000239002 [Camelus ferus]
METRATVRSSERRGNTDSSSAVSSPGLQAFKVTASQPAAQQTLMFRQTDAEESRRALLAPDDKGQPFGTTTPNSRYISRQVTHAAELQTSLKPALRPSALHRENPTLEQLDNNDIIESLQVSTDLRLPHQQRFVYGYSEKERFAYHRAWGNLRSLSQENEKPLISLFVRSGRSNVPLACALPRPVRKPPMLHQQTVPATAQRTATCPEPAGSLPGSPNLVVPGHSCRWQSPGGLCSAEPPAEDRLPRLSPGPALRCGSPRFTNGELASTALRSFVRQILLLLSPRKRATRLL